MERVMSELSVFFCSRNNINVHLILYGKKPEIFYRLPDTLEVHQPATPFVDILRPFYAFLRLRYLRKTIKTIKPDSVLSFGEYWNSFVIIATLGLNIPIYISDRCQPDKSLGTVHDFLRKHLYIKAAGIIVQTLKAKEIYQKFLPEGKLTVIGNPVRSIGYLPEEQRENIVLSVGMLLKTKNFDRLIKLFAAINMDNWKLVIVGDDALKQHNKTQLKALIEELNCERKIILTGLVSDVDLLYKKSRIFAFASGSEGFPNVIGEAISAGLPVVAFSNVVEPSKLVSDGYNGFLVPVNDYEYFKERLSQLMADDRLRQTMGVNGLNKIQDFATDIIGEKYLQLCLPPEAIH